MKVRADDVDILVKASGMNWESIYANILTEVDELLFFQRQNSMQIGNNEVMIQLGKREHELMKRLGIEDKKAFNPLARITSDLLLAQDKRREGRA